MFGTSRRAHQETVSWGTLFIATLLSVYTGQHMGQVNSQQLAAGGDHCLYRLTKKKEIPHVFAIAACRIPVTMIPKTMISGLFLKNTDNKIGVVLASTIC